MKNELLMFFKDSRNSVSREKILNLKLIYDLKVAAAIRNYDLRVFIPDVDREGYDLILDDGDDIRKYQIKSIVSAKTSSWDINKNLFRLPYYMIEKFNLTQSPETSGIGGGFVLIQADIRDSDIIFTYFYTDIYLILAMKYGLLKKSRLPSLNDVNKLLFSNIFSGRGKDKVKLTKSFLVKAKGKEELLALMGMHSRFEGKYWINNFIGYLNDSKSKKVHQKLLEDIFKKIIVL